MQQCEDQVWVAGCAALILAAGAETGKTDTNVGDADG